MKKIKLAFALFALTAMLPLLGYCSLIVKVKYDFGRTHYSSSYAPSRFQQVKIGMTENEVADLLGSPVRIIRERDKQIHLFSNAPKLGSGRFIEPFIVYQDERVKGAAVKYTFADLYFTGYPQHDLFWRTGNGNSISLLEAWSLLRSP